ncbi:hypothetical protein Tco_1062752, partial [Tanacetum coccineum]
MEKGTDKLEFEDGIVIHMLVERRYPLSKDLLQRMRDLGLEVERESFVALDLIRFIKQQIDEHRKCLKISDVDSDDEHRKCLKIVTFEGTIDSEIMEKKSFIARLNKVSSPNGDYLVIYRANGNFRAFNYLMEGDLKIMMESSTEGNDQSDFWDDQQDWKIVIWRLYEA